MTINQQMFLYAAQELNFTKAAQKAYVTQQCLSNHIARLEEQYKTKLFNREKKGVSLTPSGELLYKAFTSIDRIEKNVSYEINSDSNDVEGNVIVGLPGAYGTILVPNMVARFHKIYPHVKVDVIFENTNDLFDLLDTGKVDFFIGRDIWPNNIIDDIELAKEKFKLFITSEMLEKCTGKKAEDTRKILLEDLSKIPLASMPEDARAKQKIREFAAYNDIELTEFCRIDSYSSMLFLARMNECAFIGPESIMLSNIYKEDSIKSGKEKMHALPIENMISTIKMSAVTSKNHFLTSYAKTLLDIMIQIYYENINLVRDNK